jgi:hypothetical protein
MGQTPETRKDKKPELPSPSAVDDAIHRLLMRRPGTAIHPSFEDIQSQMDPADFKAITKLREKIEQQG